MGTECTRAYHECFKYRNLIVGHFPTIILNFLPTESQTSCRKNGKMERKRENISFYSFLFAGSIHMLSEKGHIKHNGMLKMATTKYAQTKPRQSETSHQCCTYKNGLTVRNGKHSKRNKPRNAKMMWGLFSFGRYKFFFIFLCKAIILFKLPAFIAFDLNCSAPSSLSSSLFRHGRGPNAAHKTFGNFSMNNTYVSPVMPLGITWIWCYGLLPIVSFVYFSRCHGHSSNNRAYRGSQ